MGFDKIFQRSALPSLTDAERRNASVLIVESEPSVRNSIRQTLTSLGYGYVTDSPDHSAALKKLDDRPFTHIIFEARRTNMPALEFLNKILQIDERIVAIPSSSQPTVDDVFNMLISGARGYIVKPFNQDSLDDAVVQATKGEPISDSILHAKDRNEALASLVIGCLDRLALTARQAQQFETAKRELPKRWGALKRAVEMAHLFANGGPEQFLESLAELCIERSNGPASRLGRLRKRLELRKDSKEAQDKAAVGETP